VVVNSIDDAKITPDANAAVIELAGHVTVWGCTDLVVKDIKTKLVSDSVRVTAAVELVVIDGKEVHLKLSRPAEFTTGNALTAEAASMFLGDLNAKLSSALSGMLDAREARAALPELPGADLTLADAAFGPDGSVLTLQAKGNGKLNSEAFNRALEFLTK
jgi:phage tail sheath gpL-like